MLEIELKPWSKYAYASYVPKRLQGKLYLLNLELLKKFESYGKYCIELDRYCTNVISSIFEVDYGPIVELLRHVLVFEPRIYDYPTARLIHVPRKIVEEKLGTKVLVLTENELEPYLRELARKVSCYILYQVIKKARSLQQLFMSLARMSQALEKSGIKLRRS